MAHPARHDRDDAHLCLKLIAALGLPSANTEIMDFADERVLVIIERFDRRWTRDKRLLRLPQEDCCQALAVPPTRKYDADGGPPWPIFWACSRQAMSLLPIGACS